MQIKIELLNSFMPLRQTSIKSETTRVLSMEEAQGLYAFLEKILIKMQDKSKDYWKDREDKPQKMYGLILDDIKKESTNSLQEENFENIWEDDWRQV